MFSSYLIYTHAHVHTDADTDTHTHTISHGLCEYKADSQRNPNSSKSTAWLMQVIEVDAPGYLADQQGSIDCSSPTTSDRVSPVFTRRQKCCPPQLVLKARRRVWVLLMPRAYVGKLALRRHKHSSCNLAFMQLFLTLLKAVVGTTVREVVPA